MGKIKILTSCVDILRRLMSPLAWDLASGLASGLAWMSCAGSCVDVLRGDLSSVSCLLTPDPCLLSLDSCLRLLSPVSCLLSLVSCLLSLGFAAV